MPLLAGADDAAIATHYGVDEVVRPPDLPWCRGVIVDGPDAGQEVYTVRRVGSSVITRAGTYRVVDEEPEIAPLRLAGEESSR
jgi:hypothetical protein